MRNFKFTAAAVALTGTALAAPLAEAATEVTGTTVEWEKPAVEMLMSEFADWIETNSDYGISETPIKRVTFVNKGEVVGSGERQVSVGSTTRGYYDEETATIYMVRPWFPADPYDQSVLLHEMVHHMQVNAKHWYCPQAQEWDAYKLQETWLEERGLESNFHWASILLESSCAVRDHHPD